MADVAALESTYTMGYSDDFQQLLDRRSVYSHAAQLLPLLKPGMRILDFGCGPGTISMGLAEAVIPGELHGIDMEATQIDLARAAARAGGHANATFHVGTDRSSLRRRLLQRRPRPRRAHARARHASGPGRGQTGSEAGRHHCQPRIDHFILVPPPRRRGDQQGLGHLSPCSWLATADTLTWGWNSRPGSERPGSRTSRASGSFDFFGSADDVAFFRRIHQRLVLLAQGHGGHRAGRFGVPAGARWLAGSNR